MDELLTKYMLGEASPQESEIIDRWITSSDANQKYFNHFKLIWESSKSLKIESHLDPDESWKDFQLLTRAVPPRATVMRPLNSWIKIAALWLLVCACGIWSYYQYSKPVMLTLQTGNHPASYTLSDNSKITLNMNSELTYPEKFRGDTREISLSKGEGFFEISPDKSKPFLVQVKDITVRVVGTAFNIKRTRLNTEVIVESGLVEVIREKSAVKLKPAEKVTINNTSGEFSRATSKDELYNYYRTNKFIANNTPLNRIAEVFNEVYHVNIIIKDKELGEKTLNTTFRNGPLEKNLSVIRETLNVRIDRKGNTIIIQKRI
jgi:transmembrane sensor